MRQGYSSHGSLNEEAAERNVNIFCGIELKKKSISFKLNNLAKTFQA
jgi:hypothetical protein